MNDLDCITMPYCYNKQKIAWPYERINIHIQRSDVGYVYLSISYEKAHSAGSQQIKKEIPSEVSNNLNDQICRMPPHNLYNL